MKYSARAVQLPADAGVLDRATLAIWRRWDAWVRTVLVVFAILWVVQIGLAGVAGVIAPKRISIWEWNIYSSGGVWTPEQKYLWMIGWRLATAIVAAIALRPILRRHPHGPALGVACATIVVLLLYQGAERATLIQPFGNDTKVVWNLAALVAVWSLPVIVGLLAARKRRAQPAVP